MEFYYKNVDDGVLVLSADGGLDKGTAEQFVGELLKLVESGGFEDHRRLHEAQLRLTSRVKHAVGITQEAGGPRGRRQGGRRAG